LPKAIIYLTDLCAIGGHLLPCPWHLGTLSFGYKFTKGKGRVVMETKLEASTQYGDMKGTVAIDWPDVVHFGEFLKEYGIDTKRFLPVAVEVYAGEFSESISVYGIEKSTIADNVDGIVEYARRHNDKLPVTKFDLECSFNELIKATKRFNLIATRSWAKDFTFDVQGE
jgi:hypothetical protein